MADQKADITVTCLNETCPIPLVETRKAINAAKKGQVIEVIGDHQASKKEIPMAVEALGLKLLSVTQEGNVWRIRIQK